MEEVSILEEMDVIRTVRRRKLIPLWIRIFIWIFIVFGGLGALILVLGLLGSNAELAFYGLQSNEPVSPIGLLICGLFIFKGVAAYSLWMEADWAMPVAKIDAILGIIICLAVKMVLPFVYPEFTLSVPLELALLIPYLVQLYRIEPKWKDAGGI